MYAFLIGVFVIVSFLLIFVILIQSSKGGGLAGTFGGSGIPWALFLAAEVLVHSCQDLLRFLLACSLLSRWLWV